MATKRHLVDIEAADLAGVAKVLAGIRLFGVVFMILDVPDEFCQHLLGRTLFTVWFGHQADPAAAWGIITDAYQNWFSTEPYLPVVLAIEIVVSLLLSLRWDGVGVAIADSWWWPILEAAMTLTLAYAHGWLYISDTVTISTLLLLACLGARRGIGAGLAVMVVSFVAVNLPGALRQDEATLPSQLSAVLISCCSIVGGVAIRHLVLSRGRTSRLQAVAVAREAAAQERIRGADEIHDGLSKTLNGSRLMATALVRELKNEGDLRQVELAGRLVDTLAVATNESRALLVRLRGEAAVDLSAVCRLAVAQFSQSVPDAEVTMDVPSRPVEVKSPIYQDVALAVSELLENLRQSRAKLVHVSLTCDADVVRVMVTGEDASSARALDMTRGGRIGRFSLDELAQGLKRIGASVEQTPWARGISVTISFPAGQADAEVRDNVTVVA